MITDRHLLLPALATAIVILTSCNGNGLFPSNDPDPAGTVEAWVPVGGGIPFNGRYLTLTDQMLFRAGAINQMEFSKGVSVNGLGSIKSIPKTNYAWWTEAVPGCGYVIHLTTDSFYGLMESWARLYVVGYTYTESRARNGVNVKYEINWWPN